MQQGREEEKEMDLVTTPYHATFRPSVEIVSQFAPLTVHMPLPPPPKKKTSEKDSRLKIASPLNQHTEGQKSHLFFRRERRSAATDACPPVGVCVSRQGWRGQGLRVLLRVRQGRRVRRRRRGEGRKRPREEGRGRQVRKVASAEILLSQGKKLYCNWVLVETPWTFCKKHKSYLAT